MGQAVPQDVIVDLINNFGLKMLQVNGLNCCENEVKFDCCKDAQREQQQQHRPVSLWSSQCADSDCRRSEGRRSGGDQKRPQVTHRQVCDEDRSQRRASTFEGGLTLSILLALS